MDSLSTLIKWNKSFIIVVGLAFILLLGLFDYLTGYELSFAIFYILPISFVAWFAGFRGAIIAAVISVTTWHMSNHLAGETLSNPVIAYWNMASRLGVFLCVALLIAKLRETLEHERALAQ